MTKAFDEYLKQYGFSQSTRSSYSKTVGYFLKWCCKEGVDYKTASVDELYAYKDSLSHGELSQSYIRMQFTALKYYYWSIGREDNPALRIKHAKAQKRMPQHLLSEESLSEFYRSIETYGLVQRRNKIVLGLMIFQAMKIGEITALTLGSINLDNYTIRVQKTSKTNSRTLKLEVEQIKGIMDYLYEERTQLLIERGSETDRLFFSIGSGHRLRNMVDTFLRDIRRKHIEIRSCTQLRESRISIWVKEHGIRKAQYLSGMKYASSMMRYQTKDIESLRQKLEVVHPMQVF